MHEELGPEVKVYGLNVPAFGENQQTLEAFAEQSGLTYPVIDHEGSIHAIRFSGDGGAPYPRDAIIDQQGRVVYASNEYQSQAIWDTVEELLDEGE